MILFIGDIIISGSYTFESNIHFRIQMLNYLLSIPDLMISNK